MPMYYDADADLDLLSGKTVAVIGYGSQGHAHALNLRDSGVSVVVGLRPGSASVEAARQEGLEVLPPAEAAARGDLIMILAPDELQGELFRRDIAPGLAPGDALLFAHGFSIHFGQVVPPRAWTCSWWPPRARAIWCGAPTPRARACRRCSRWPRTRAAGQAARAGLRQGHRLHARGRIETTFAEETETDLFGEQVVLCGGLTELVRAAFDTLVDAGYNPDLAYFECCHELKLIVDLIYEKGISGMRYSHLQHRRVRRLHPRAAASSRRTRAPRCARSWTRSRAASSPRSGSPENLVGRPSFNAIARRDADHQVEQVGQRLRGMMSWIDTEF